MKLFGNKQSHYLNIGEEEFYSLGRANGSSRSIGGGEVNTSTVFAGAAVKYPAVCVGAPVKCKINFVSKDYFSFIRALITYPSNNLEHLYRL